MFEKDVTCSGATRKVQVISSEDIERLLHMGEALQALERAFRLDAEGKTIMPPKLYLDMPEYKGDFRAMPAYINGSAGLKWVSGYLNSRVTGQSTNS